MAATKNYKNPANSANKISNPVQVYCRLRPLKMSTDISSAQIRNLTTVLFPNGANSLQLKQNPDHETHYVFKQVFDDGATQADIFNVVARPLVERLVRGCNSLLFTYGVTGSGKTYTMTGVENQCGILPRCLKTLFETIAGYHAPKRTFQSDHLNGFEIVTEMDMKQSNNREVLKSARSAMLRRKNSEIDFNLESIGPVWPVSGINEHHIYAVFVSYVEIYNNSVYDLLEGGGAQKVLQSHIVREDSNRNMYIHGATELEISSEQEAIEVFQTGQKRKRMGQTALNAESSRSHSIFNIRLVQAPSQNHAMSEENLITISQLSLVDLAGSERSSRTNNTGARLREAGNINNSLMKLRECLEYLRENQQAANGSVPKKIPYRDSKLTYLFKNFFEGEGQVSMVVCINPNIKDVAENVQVLKFAEMTQEVQIVNTKPIALSTPLKRQAWNKENTELAKEFGGLPTDDETSEFKIIPPSSIKKPVYYLKHIETHKPQSINLNHELDFSQKKIMFLEKQNLELRLELTRIREAYEKLTGRPWCNEMIQRSSASIFATVRKPLLARQKTNITENIKQPQGIRKQATHIEGSLLPNGANGAAFQAELKLKLQKQRKKLEQDLIGFESEKKCEKERQSHGCDVNKINAEVNMHTLENKENNNESEPRARMDFKKEKRLITVKDTPRKMLAFDKHNLSSREIKPVLNKANTYTVSPICTPRSKKMKFEECIQMDVFASFRMLTPKTDTQLLKHSTPHEQTPASAKRRLDFFNDNIITPKSCKMFSKTSSLQRDLDFDKREQELSLKMESHRKKQKGNKYLMDILCSVRRSKSSSSLFHKSTLQKNLFAKESKQRSFSDEES